MTSMFDLYESRLQADRRAFREATALRGILEPNASPEQLAVFFVYFNALGVSMTEPVERWINASAARCGELGYAQQSRALFSHAKHEAGHHLMLIEDTRKLVAALNSLHGWTLDCQTLLGLAPTAGVRAYVELHERTIASDAPFAQLGIEYEIERLSVEVGPLVIAQCTRLLGRDALAGLSFLEDHVALDAGHTKFNRAAISRLLASHPSSLEALVEAGRSALQAYGLFVDGCWELARKAQA